MRNSNNDDLALQLFIALQDYNKLVSLQNQLYFTITHVLNVWECTLHYSRRGPVENKHRMSTDPQITAVRSVTVMVERIGKAVFARCVGNVMFGEVYVC